MSNYCPGAAQSPQPGGGGLNASLPARATWHITWDALRPDGSQPQFSAVSNYLKNVGYCPHIMWNPFTGYMEQYYPASQSARALAAWNEDGAVNVQIEIFFTPGCVVDGVKYTTVADTPLVGFDILLDWLDSLGIPRTWPLGSPQWQGNSRDSNIWNTQGGHYGHCNVPDNTHTDPGPMPALTGISVQSATVTQPQEEPLVPNESDKVFWPIEGAEKVSLNELLNSIDRKASAALASITGLLSVQLPDPSDPGKTYSLADFVVWSATNAKIAAGAAGAAASNTDPAVLAKAVSEGAASVDAAAIAEKLTVSVREAK